MDPSLRALIEQAEFKESFRGYDRAQVDDALEQLASRAGKLESEVAKAAERVEAARRRARAEAEAEAEARVEAEIEARMAAAGQPEQDSAEQVRLTIVMAQRTADAAIREAKAEAEQLVAQARDEAGRTIAEARADNAREREEARQRLVAEIRELEGAREALRGNVNELNDHVGQQREQVAAVLDQLRRLLDDPSSLREQPAPPLTQVTIPDDEPSQGFGPEGEQGVAADSSPERDSAEEAASGEEFDPWVGEPPASAAAPEGSEGIEPTDSAEPGEGPEPTESAEPGEGPPEATESAEPGEGPEPTERSESAEPAEPAGPIGSAVGGEEDALPSVQAHGGPAVVVEIEAEPVQSTRDRPQPTVFDADAVVDHADPGIADHGVTGAGELNEPAERAEQRAEQDEEPGTAPPAPIEEDPFLAELRKAMTDDEPLGPREPPMPVADRGDAARRGPDAEERDRHRSRFGRRR